MVNKVMTKMLTCGLNTVHDINHLLKVWSYARNIGITEGMTGEELEILEIAAILHDIACPVIRPRYGYCPGHLQEKEGPGLAEEFLQEFNLPEKQKQRVLFLIGHHHTLTQIDGLDYQILIEADFLVNADESKASDDEINQFGRTNFKTAAGRKLLERIYGVKL